MQKADHSGHRSRMKKKLMEQGIEVFEPHEVLEILLYYAIPQRNTNPIAKNLIDHFGSLSQVLDASIESLREQGLTEHQALLLKLIPGVTRRYLDDKRENRDVILEPSTIPGYVADKFIGLEREERVLLLLVDKKGKEVYCGFIALGGFDAVDISVRKIVSIAVNHGASYAYLAHNHPSGLALPSKQDILTTRSIKSALKPIGIHLIDHYIVADGECVSLADSDFI